MRTYQDETKFNSELAHIIHCLKRLDTHQKINYVVPQHAVSMRVTGHGDWKGA